MPNPAIDHLTPLVTPPRATPETPAPASSASSGAEPFQEHLQRASGTVEPRQEPGPDSSPVKAEDPQPAVAEEQQQQGADVSQQGSKTHPTERGEKSTPSTDEKQSEKDSQDNSDHVDLSKAAVAVADVLVNESRVAKAEDSKKAADSVEKEKKVVETTAKKTDVGKDGQAKTSRPIETSRLENADGNNSVPSPQPSSVPDDNQAASRSQAQDTVVVEKTTGDVTVTAGNALEVADKQSANVETGVQANREKGAADRTPREGTKGAGGIARSAPDEVPPANQEQATPKAEAVRVQSLPKDSLSKDKTERKDKADTRKAAPRTTKSPQPIVATEKQTPDGEPSVAPASNGPHVNTNSTPVESNTNAATAVASNTSSEAATALKTSIGRLRRSGSTASRVEGESTPAIDRARFVQRVGHALRTAQQGDGRLQLRLSPPELGSLRIEIAVKHGVVTAHLETETPAARKVLLDNLPMLRDRLAQHDARIEKFDVDVQRDGQQNTGNPSAQHRHFSRPPTSPPTSRRTSNNKPEMITPAATTDAELIPAIDAGLDVRI